MQSIVTSRKHPGQVLTQIFPLGHACSMMLVSTDGKNISLVSHEH